MWLARRTGRLALAQTECQSSVMNSAADRLLNRARRSRSGPGGSCDPACTWPSPSPSRSTLDWSWVRSERCWSIPDRVPTQGREILRASVAAVTDRPLSRRRRHPLALRPRVRAGRLRRRADGSPTSRCAYQAGVGGGRGRGAAARCGPGRPRRGRPRRSRWPRQSISATGG